MLSVHPDIRNYLGQVFVELRIKYEQQFRKLFPGNHSETYELESERKLRKEWTMRLTAAAKDNLFNMFHNKSDEFLNNVGKGRIRIVGPPKDHSWKRFEAFGDVEGDSIPFDADLVVPGIGFQSTLDSLTGEKFPVDDFPWAVAMRNMTVCSRLDLRDRSLATYRQSVKCRRDWSAA